jgi:folate-binding protein YgfZ
MNMDEYNAALNGAALFDRTGTGIIEVKGPDAANFLNNISTNDFVNLPGGHGCESYFCDHRAKTLFHVFVRRFSKETFLLDTEPGYGGKLHQHLEKYLISEAVELADRTAEIAVLHCCGSQAVRFADGTLEEFQHTPRPLGTLAADCRRRTILGVAGFDLFVPAVQAAALRLYLQGEGMVLGSAEVFDVLRIEAGTPIYGKDIDENRFVMEVANAARAVCYTKGCFIGQEPIVMSRDRAGQVNRLFLGIKLAELLPPGTKLFREGAEIGAITSSTFSPRLNAPLALAYLKRPHVETGMKVQDNAGREIGEILGYPPLQRSSIC